MDLIGRIGNIIQWVVVIVIGCAVILVAALFIKYWIQRLIRRLRVPVRVREHAKTLTETNSGTIFFSSERNIVEDVLAGILLDGRVNNSSFRVARNMVIDCMVMIDCWGKELHRGYIDLYTTNHSKQSLLFAQKFISLDRFSETSSEELGTLIHLTTVLFRYVVAKQAGLFLSDDVDEKIKAWLEEWDECGGAWCFRKPPPFPLFGNGVFDYYGDNGKNLADLFDCWHRLCSNDGLLNREGRKGLREFIEKLGRRNFATGIIRLVSSGPFGRGRT